MPSDTTQRYSRPSKAVFVTVVSVAPRLAVEVVHVSPPSLLYSQRYVSFTPFACTENTAFSPASTVCGAGWVTISSGATTVSFTASDTTVCAPWETTQRYSRS